MTFRVNDPYTLNMAEKKKDDPAMVKIREIFEESGLTLVELGKRMGYSDEMARQAAWQFMKSADPRMSMLRKFAEAMGMPLDQLTPKGKRKRMSRKLDVELSEYGCAISPTDFRDVLIDRKHATSPAWTIDELVCHPDEAKEYCQLIRSELKCPDMEDAFILRSLMNIRRSN